MDGSTLDVLRPFVECGGDPEDAITRPFRTGITPDTLKDYHSVDGILTLTDNVNSLLLAQLHEHAIKHQTQVPLDTLHDWMTDLEDAEAATALVTALSREPVPSIAELKAAIAKRDTEQRQQHFRLASEHVLKLQEYGAPQEDVDRYLCETAAKRLDLSSTGVTSLSRGILTAHELFDQYLQNYGAGADMGVMTGIRQLDEIWSCGWKPGELVVITGEEYTGKTALLLKLLDNMNEEGPVAFVSCEQNPEPLLNRLIASRTGFDVNRIKARVLTGEEKARVSEEAKLMSSSEKPFFLIPPEEASRSTTLFARLRSLTANHKLRAIGVDFAMLINATELVEHRTARSDEQITALFNALMQIATEAQCPLIVVHPLTAVQAKEARKPGDRDLSDLAGCKFLRYLIAHALLVYRNATKEFFLKVMKAKDHDFADPKIQLGFDFVHMQIKEATWGG